MLSRIGIGTAVAGVLGAALTGSASHALGATSLTAQILYTLQIPPGQDNIVASYAANGVVLGSSEVDESPIDTPTIWTGPAGTPSFFTEPGSSPSVHSTDGSSVVGTYTSVAPAGYHAAVWSVNGSFINDLNPGSLGFTSSSASDVAGQLQVGSASYQTRTTTVTHAFAWSGTAASAVDLNPSSLGFTTSSATATDGTQIVGSGGSIAPILWTSPNAASAVNLSVASSFNISNLRVTGVGGGEQVGYGQVGAFGHSILWSGTASSAIDLNPPKSFGFRETYAMATNDGCQAGFGAGDETGGGTHAIWWNGTPQSIVDLHNLLPSGYLWNYSMAYSVDASGNVFGIAETQDSAHYAIEWSPVPEPTAGMALVGGAAVLLRRRRA